MEKKVTLSPTTVVWRAKSKVGEKPRDIPFKDMSEDHLQKALWSVQKRYSNLSKKMDNYLMIEEALEKEAENRGISLRDYSEEEAKQKVKEKRSSK